MAVYHGKSGTVSFTGISKAVLAWSLSSTADVAESSVAGQTWKTFEAGFKDCTASIETNRNATDSVIQAGLEATLALGINQSNTLGANCICTEQTETVSIEDISKMSYSFVMDDVDGVAYN